MQIFNGKVVVSEVLMSSWLLQCNVVGERQFHFCKILSIFEGHREWSKTYFAATRVYVSCATWNTVKLIGWDHRALWTLFAYLCCWGILCGDTEHWNLSDPTLPTTSSLVGCQCLIVGTNALDAEMSICAHYFAWNMRAAKWVNYVLTREIWPITQNNKSPCMAHIPSLQKSGPKDSAPSSEPLPLIPVQVFLNAVITVFCFSISKDTYLS